MLLILLMLGCLNSKEECNETRSDQTGSYEMKTDWESGNCGGIGDLEVKVDRGIVYVDESIGCTLTEQSWEPETCTTRSVHDCNDGVWAMNMRWQVTSTGEGELSGRLEAWMLDIYGYECEGSWTFKATKLDQPDTGE